MTVTSSRVTRLYCFAYEDTDMPSGMTCREWVRAGRPVNETAPAAEATAPARDQEGSRSLMAVTDCTAVDDVTLTIETLQALEGVYDPAVSVSATVHVRTTAQFDAIVRRAHGQGFPVSVDRTWPCERAGNQRRAVIGKGLVVYCPVDAPVGDEDAPHEPTDAELADLFRAAA